MFSDYRRGLSGRVAFESGSGVACCECGVSSVRAVASLLTVLFPFGDQAWVNYLITVYRKGELNSF